MPTAVKQMEMSNMTLPTKKVGQDNPLQREDQLKKACRDFESIFVNYMMKQMRQTVNKSDVMGTSQAEKLYTSMLDSEVAKNVSQSRGIGLASIIYRQMGGVIDAGQQKNKVFQDNADEGSKRTQKGL